MAGRLLGSGVWIGRWVELMRCYDDAIEEISMELVMGTRGGEARLSKLVV